MFKPTIGLEVHAELKTKTKMFCNSANDPDEKEPNVNICPVCMAHPGTLPTINKEAVKSVLRVGKALGSGIADFTEFDRKNYFYPDIPKGYQISQYKYPLVSGGQLAGVDITRVHLEEDTAKSFHDNKTGETLVDFNRAGVPLMELVTEPVIESAKQAGDFGRELNLLLGPRYLNVSEANMEKGEMRVEANISISKEEGVFGTKVEVKNLNSFRSVERAIEFELKRQQELLEKGEEVVQETRGFDEEKGITFSQRKKETSKDYRYFPDPDLPKLYISEIKEFADLEKTLPELPSAKRERYEKDYGIKAEDIESFVYDPALAELFETVMAENRGIKAQLAANYITSDLAGLLKNNTEAKVPDKNEFAELIKMADSNEISSRGAKDILLELATKGGEARKIAETKGLFQKSDKGELVAVAQKIIKANPAIVEQFKNGDEKVVQFLIGQGMKETQGSANPQILREVFIEELRK